MKPPPTNARIKLMFLIITIMITIFLFNMLWYASFVYVIVFTDFTINVTVE